MDRSLSILHVDDDAGLRSLVQTYLERPESGLACTVTTAASADEALALLRDESATFDCVISDYDMPGTNGIELLRSIRDIDPELPFLLFSGEETNELAADVIEAGVTDYMKKGLGTEQYTMLIRRVEHAVDADGQFDPETDVQLDGVGIVGPDETFESVDDTYAELYEYDPGEVEGRFWEDLHPSEEVEHIRNNVLPVVAEGGKWAGRSKGLRSDGTTFTESKMVTALDDGRLLIAVSEYEDEKAENDNDGDSG